MAALGDGCRWKDGDYCLFKSPRDVMGSKLKAEDIVKLQTRLHVISSSLHCLQEVKVVQGAACVRVRYFELQSGKGTVTTFTTGMFGVPVQIYSCVVDLKGPKDEQDRPVYLVVCLSLHSDGLELFIPELDSFVENLTATLRPLPEDEVLLVQSFPNSSADKLIVSWQSYIQYIAKFVETYQHQLPALLHCILNHTVEVCGEDQDMIKDLEMFISTCTLDSITAQQSAELKRALSSNDGGLVTVTVGKMGALPTLSLSSSEVTSPFADKWCKAMLAATASQPASLKPFALKKVIKSTKLKIIQDINLLKRLLKEAETDYYALYKCFTFLQASGNKDVLFRCSLEDQKSQELISTLREFFKQQKAHSTDLSSSESPLIQF